MAEWKFEIEIEGFSGPLDVLCHLLESREIEASTIQVSDIIATYSVFLTRTGRISIYEAAEFLSLCSRVLLGKIRGLLPGGRNLEKEESETPTTDEEALLETLERYRPYRAAGNLLKHLQKLRERHFTRPVEEEPLTYELGDLYFLCRQWWKLYAIYSGERNTSAGSQGAYSEGFLDPVPEEEQVEKRIREIQQQLQNEDEIPLGELVQRGTGRTILVVTILALLEMCRLGYVDLRQEKGFGQLRVRSLKHAISNGTIY
ncbi:MAG: segregation and condensation protein A [Thermovirgaceae bacterium]